VITVTGERIGYDTCFARDCLRPLDRCACPGGPTPPGLGAGAGPLTFEPLTFEPEPVGAPLAA
jgi:hypothetical protein